MDEKEIYETLGLTPPGGGEDTADSATATSRGRAELNGATNPAAPEEAVSNSDTAEDGGESAGDKPEDAGQPVGDGKTQTETGKAESSSLSAQQAAAVGRPEGGLGQGQLRRLTADQEVRWRTLTQQEVQRAVAAEQARNQAQWHEFFAAAGLKNSLDGGKPITSLEEFQQWKNSYDRARLEQELKAGRLTPEMFDSAVRAAVERVSSPDQPGPLETSPQPAPQRAAGQVTKEQIDAELAEIHRLDGSVNGLEDILKMETGMVFQEAVLRGNSFLDAFKLANFDRIQSQRQAEAAQRAAQAARNNSRNKEHLRASGSKSGGSVAVPGDVLEMYRMMMPNATEAEITAHYNRMLKEMKN